MTIQKNNVTAVSVEDLLRGESAQNLQIPPYQRPYSWSPATALQLLHDIDDARRDVDRSEIPYVLGAVILHEADGKWNVVDGQQRLLTLRMMLDLLDSGGGGEVIPDHGSSPLSLVWNALRDQIEHYQPSVRDDFCSFLLKSCHLVRIVTDDEDEAFRVFDSQNYRGKALAPHDLLKAHHLREMRGESEAMQMAIVETWESVEDGVLNNLFSNFLYRISKWSRGESAPGFTTYDIGMFKGISNKSGMPPSVRYHQVAQTLMPMLKALDQPSEDEGRNIRHSQFQLDAPLLAGRHFFEMVTFLLEEMSRLRQEAFAGDYGQFSGKVSRYRYVSDLYLAAFLYYTNKFGVSNADSAIVKRKLFAWAYSLRVQLFRVQFLSVDNLASAKDKKVSAFVLMRNTIDSRVVHQLTQGGKPYGDDHEKSLVKFLEG